MKLNLNKFLYSISFALDLAENEILSVSSFHSKRVAFIAIQLANILNFTDEEKFDIYSYSLLHDNGILEAYQNDIKDVDENFKDHCIIGEKNILAFPFLTGQKDIILYHHEHYDGSGFFGKKGDEIPLMSQVIFLADKLDTEFNLKNITYETKIDIERFLTKNTSKLFSPLITSKFLELSQQFSFWGSLEYFYTTNQSDVLISNYTIEISIEEFLHITDILSNLIDSKSKFTATHSKELSRKTQEVIQHFNFTEDNQKKLLISANLHDIGKLATPLNILDKNGPLNDSELFEIKKHAFFTYKILEGIDFCDDILHWASSHHEKPDGSGYPFGLKQKELSIEARIISCLDFYQALVEDRPYRKAMKHSAAIEIMKTTLVDFDADIEIIDVIDSVFKPESNS